MEWDLKLPPWDLAELDRDAMPSIGSAVGLTGGLGHQASVLDCSVDLKLGGLGEFGAPDKWKDRPKLRKMAPVPCSSSKRARMQGNGSQNTSCLVDGCKADLSKCREYHQRHRVCEVHSKTPSAMVGRQEQRFCQQCSRFHLLIEFDEVKRSCRKRLDAHNKRRRKPQLDSVGSSNLFPNPQGTRFLSHPQIFSTATSEPKWAGIIKTEGGNLFARHPPLHLIDGPEHLNGFLAQTFKEGKQFPFLQDTVTAIRGRSEVETPVCRSQHKTIESNRSKIFSEGLAEVPDSDCALSLLSTSTQISGINLGQMVSASKIPMGQPLVPSLHYGNLNQFSHCQASSSVCSDGFSCSGMENEHAGTLLVSDAGDTDFHSQSMFHDGCQGLADGNSFSLPFSWQ